MSISQKIFMTVMMKLRKQMVVEDEIKAGQEKKFQKLISDKFVKKK